jgi:hypothetical protein
VKQTVDYFKDRYLEEQARFDHFENKCSKFLTFITAIVAGVIALASIRDGVIFRPSSELGWLALVIFLFGSFVLLCAWGHSLRALKIGDCSVMPKKRDTATYLVDIGDAEGQRHIFNCYVDTIERLSDEIDKKSRNLELAYEELTISAYCMSVVAVIITFMEITK